MARIQRNAACRVKLEQSFQLLQSVVLVLFAAVLYEEIHVLNLRDVHVYLHRRYLYSA